VPVNNVKCGPQWRFAVVEVRCTLRETRRIDDDHMFARFLAS